MNGGFSMDTSTGNTDLAWMLVLLFFVTTFIALRPAALVSEVAADEGPQGQPIVLGFSEAPPAAPRPQGDLEDLHVVAPGEHLPPAAGASVAAWLGATCEANAGQLVQVRCPEDAAHSWCSRQLKALLKASPG